MSLRIKIIIVAVASLLFALCANAGIVLTLFTSEYSQALEVKTVVVARSLELQLDRLLAFGIPLEELVGFEEQMKAVLDQNQEIDAAYVIDPSGEPLFFSGDSSMQASQEALYDLLRTQQEAYEANGNRYAVAPMYDSNDALIGAVVLQFSSEVITQKVQVLLFYTLLVAAAAFAVTTVIILLLLNVWLTRPLDTLLIAVQNIGKGDLSVRAKVEANDEIGQLASAFNAMTENLIKTTVSRDDLAAEIAEREKTEAALKQRTDELETLNKMMVNRELKMIELKNQVAALQQKRD